MRYYFPFFLFQPIPHYFLVRIDPTGEFSQQRQNYFLFWSRTKSSADVIKGELKYVREETKSKTQKLQHASTVQTGLEILHHFILDLLGRFVLILLFLSFYFFSFFVEILQSPKSF